MRAKRWSHKPHNPLQSLQWAMIIVRQPGFHFYAVVMVVNTGDMLVKCWSHMPPPPFQVGENSAAERVPNPCGGDGCGGGGAVAGGSSHLLGGSLRTSKVGPWAVSTGRTVRVRDKNTIGHQRKKGRWYEFGNTLINKTSIAKKN